jgi:hypothetical protein
MAEAGLADKFSGFAERRRPKPVARLNGPEVKQAPRSVRCTP